MKFAGDKLNELIKIQIIRNCVKMAVFLVAVLISGASLFAFSVLIFALLAHSVVASIPKAVRLVKNFWRIPVWLMKGLSPSQTVAEYVAS